MSNSISILPIKTRRLDTPQDDLFEAIRESDFKPLDGDIVIVASKVVAIHEGNCVSREENNDWDELIKREADLYIDRSESPGGFMMHTMKDGILTAAAGIDGGNSGDYYILWPEDSMKSAELVKGWIEEAYSVKNIAVVVNDSRCYPFRRGTVGIALGWAGIEPLYDYRGMEDLFGKRLKISQMNTVDCIGTMGVFAMGEGAESTPVVIVRGYDTGSIRTHDRDHEYFNTLVVPMEEEAHGNFFKNAPWKKGGGGATSRE